MTKEVNTLQVSDWPPYTHSVTTYPPAEMTECGKQLAAAQARVRELEGDLSVAKLQLSGIAEQVEGNASDEAGLRLVINNIRFILNLPARQPCP